MRTALATLPAPALAPAGSGPEDYALQVEKAWRGELTLTDLFTAAATFEGQKRYALAAVLYQTWLARNKTPHNHLACFNLGVALLNAGDTAGAKAAYMQAVGLSPGFAQAHFNLGLALERLGEHDAALAEWTWVRDNTSVAQADARALHLLALNNLGRLSESQRRYTEAIAALTASLAVEPDQPDVMHHLVFLRARQCAWPVYAPLPGVDPQALRDNTSAMAMIALSDDPAEQLAAARRFVAKKIKLDVPHLAPARAYGHRKLRVAYLSSDFCLHPVAMLTAELFELHERSRFELFAYDWSREDGSALRARVIKAMDHFHRIDGLTDEAAAQLVRSHEIDILVDLQGQTLGARPNLLAYRPAPIQITYLGLPATTGLPFIDYVIADRFLIPPEYAQFYSEKPLYLPDIYQCSDRRRVVAAAPTREACGLPAQGTVFCCFNNNYKYTAEMFGAWMRILARVPGSVLWLLSDNPGAEANLRAAAASHGMEASRIVFARRTAPEHYLARYHVADLFLDSYPFNAGTTANDALFVGLPVLTRSGRTFASRMAGALLTAAGVPELITWDLQAYEDKAVALGRSPGELQRLRAQLAKVKTEGVLFDTPRFARNLEQQYERLVATL